MGEDEDGNVDDLEININAKAGDDIEELATYINGQSDMINASVSEDGKLQVLSRIQTFRARFPFLVD